jgi:hypothetical protein
LDRETKIAISVTSGITVNQKVNDAFDKVTSRKRGCYHHYSTSEKICIGHFASQNGNAAAVRKYSKELEYAVSESTVRTFKTFFQKCLKDGTVTQEPDSDQTVLTGPKRGRKTLLGDEMEKDLIDCLKSLRVAGGIVNASIVIATATGSVETKFPDRLEKNGGDLKL